MSIAAPPTAKRIPTSAEQQADLSERDLGTEGDRPEKLWLDPLAEKERAADDHEREGQEAAEPVADHGVRPCSGRVFGLQRSSTPPEE